MAQDDRRRRGKGLRADARENRERILAAAKDVFAELGVDAPMVEVARRAGVGIATLFRRFPDKEALIAEAFAAKMTAYADAMEAALADPDPGRGFEGFILRVAEMQSEDRGFTRALTMGFTAATLFGAERQRAFEGFQELIRRAKAAGVLREDFVPQDLGLLLVANAGVIGALGDAAPDAWRRVVAYLLQSFRPGGASPLPPPPEEGLLGEVMANLQRRNRAAGQRKGRGS